MIKSKHVMLVPLQAYGHIIPLLQLAKKLKDVHHVTFVVTQFFVEDMRQRDLWVESDNFKFHIIQDGFVPDANYGKTELPNLTNLLACCTPKIELLISSLNNPKNPDSSFVDALIIDNNMAKMATPLHEKDIPVYYFETEPADGITLKALMLDENCPVIELAPGLWPIFERSDSSFNQPLPELSKRLFLDVKKLFIYTKGLIVNSARELEKETVEKFLTRPEMVNHKLFMVGPLIPTMEKVCAKDHQQEHILKWINEKEARTVIYVSFGTIGNPGPEQLTEIGKALLLTGRPFIWSLNSKFHEFLPEQIKNKIWNQFEAQKSPPFLLVSWVPQRLILSHKATGAFLSHCGWNSCLETLSSGVPVIGWPMLFDQGINAQLLADHGMAVVVPGTGLMKNQLVPMKEVAQFIEKIMTTKNYFHNAQKLRIMLNDAVQAGGSSHCDLKDLIETI